LSPGKCQFRNICNAFLGFKKKFVAKKLILNFDKTIFMEFDTNTNTCITLNIGCDNKTTLSGYYLAYELVM